MRPEQAADRMGRDRQGHPCGNRKRLNIQVRPAEVTDHLMVVGLGILDDEFGEFPVGVTGLHDRGPGAATDLDGNRLQVTALRHEQGLGLVDIALRLTGSVILAVADAIVVFKRGQRGVVDGIVAAARLHPAAEG